MPTSTTNYELIKPGTDDPILIEQLNTNADIIDNALKENADALGGKVDKETGKGLSTNDFTTVEKTKLDDLAEIKSIGTGLNLDDNGELTATGGGSGGTTNYNDLSNKPQINGNTLSGNKTSAQLGLASASDIPTVPITAIQKNGTGITPVSGTVNITVPTTAADVLALPDTTKYAAALSLTINSSTFVMTGQLKDQNGDNLGTAQTIDLPLESVVVGGSYNSQTKEVVLTLQNGNTIEFSVADLVSGLQTELSASNKLNPAYINYDSTHRAVSDTEKSTWNGKQNAIDNSHKLSADLVDDTNATNKFATAEELEQIQTNKNNISLTGYADDIISTSFNWSDGFIWISGSVNSSTQSQFSQPFLLHAGEKITVQTSNKNIGIICTTTADSVQVGDTVTVLKATSGTSQEEAYSYTASDDIKIVICVLKSNYDAYVSQKSSLKLCDWITLKIRSMQST